MVRVNKQTGVSHIVSATPCTAAKPATVTT